MTQSITACFLVAFFALVSPVSAGATEGPLAALAAPGQCAEPRSAAASDAGEDFAVVGPVSSLFDPRDVAAGPPASAVQGPLPPNARAFVRPGSCDQPGSGCGAVLSTRTEVVVPPVDPGVRPPRVNP